MSATGHQLRRRLKGAARVMELLGENPNLAEVSERFKLGGVTTKEELLTRLQARSDVDGIIVQLEVDPVRQQVSKVEKKTEKKADPVEKAEKTEEKAEEKTTETAEKAAEKVVEKAPKAPKAKKAKGKK